VSSTSSALIALKSVPSLGKKDSPAKKIITGSAPALTTNPVSSPVKDVSKSASVGSISSFSHPVNASPMKIVQFSAPSAFNPSTCLPVPGPCTSNPTVSSVKKDPISNPPSTINQSNAVKSPAKKTPGDDISLPLELKGCKVISISMLDPHLTSWTVRGRILQKANMHHYTNYKGPGKVFSFLIADSSGEIRISAFNEIADKFYDVIEEKAVFYVSGGKIKEANKKFSTANNKYEAWAGRETVILQCTEADDAAPGDMKYNFVKISDIENLPVDSHIGK
jgi:hypothetical protein